MPDPDRLLKTLYKAADAVRQTPGRKGRFVQLNGAAEVLVVGDLHGNLHAFKKVLVAAALDRHPQRHLVLQELIHGPVFYPENGGDRSHQLLDVVAALKCQYPERTHLILGNHELSELTGRTIGKDGETLNAKFLQGVTTAYGAAALEVYQAIRRDGTQKNVVAKMQTRDDLYKYLDYHAYERKLDELFASEKKK